jgi:hypothetical protein
LFLHNYAGRSLRRQLSPNESLDKAGVAEFDFRRNARKIY